MAYIPKESGTISHPILLARKTIIFAHQRQVRILPTFVSSENLLADAASRFWTLTLPDAAVLVSLLRSPSHRCFHVEVGSSLPLLRKVVGSWCGSPGRSSATMGLFSGLRVSPSSNSPLHHLKDDRLLRCISSRDSLLASPEVVSGHSGSPCRRRALPSRVPASFAPDVGFSSLSPPSSRLEDFWRLRGLKVSDTSFRLICNSWRCSSLAQYDAAWWSFRNFLNSRQISLFSVNFTTTDGISVQQ